MKRMTNKMMTAAAVLMITAGVASAQDAMKAEIPFAFSAGGKMTEPGSYMVRITQGASSTKIVGLYNETTRQTYMVAAMNQSDAPKAWKVSGVPRAAFDCSTGACSLRRIWFGDGNAYDFHGPKTKSGELQLTEILLKSGTKGD